MLCAIVFLLAGTATAYPPLLASRQSGFSGIATFNNYGSQGSTTCGPLSGISGTYGAAASDISPNISGGKCDGGINPSQCNGYSPGYGFQAPQCPKTNCGTCYRVTNRGGVDGGSVGGVGNSVIVQIIDSCPSTSAQNFCKTNVPANQRCGDSSTNQLDIDQGAYPALTGQGMGSGPTLNIEIEPTCCPGSNGCQASASSNGGANGGTQNNGQSTNGGTQNYGQSTNGGTQNYGQSTNDGTQGNGQSTNGGASGGISPVGSSYSVSPGTSTGQSNWNGTTKAVSKNKKCKRGKKGKRAKANLAGATGK